MTGAAIEESYLSACEAISRQRDDVRGRMVWISRVRIALFLAGIGGLAWIEAARDTRIALGLFTAAFIGFGIAVWRTGKLRKQLHRLDARWQANHEAVLRIRRDWGALPEPVGHADPEHPCAQDLDVFGRASLTQLIGSVKTVAGRAMLRDWLLTPSETPAVRERQVAVAELAGRLGFRQDLEVAARQTGRVAPVGLELFCAWAEADPWMPPRRGLLWYARFSTVLVPVLVALHLSGVIPVAVWILPLLVNAAVIARTRPGLQAVLDGASAHEGAFAAYAEMLRVFDAGSFESARLNMLQRDTGAGSEPIHRHLARCHAYVVLADTRHASMIYPVLLITVLWDVHIAALLDDWRARYGRLARRWMATVGEVEALSGLGSLAAENPDWTFAELDAQGPAQVAAARLGHPLLRAEHRVANDVTVGPPGSFLLVTGSNMSGKSTLLRSLGTNVLLAQAGGPVCAARLRLSSVRIFTSMRIQDSLETGVSYFMAALQRLKHVVDASRHGAPTLLFLLDELLQGTNSAERMVAVREVIRELVDNGAIGAVTTHDLALADVPELQSAMRPVHFRETIAGDGGGAAMTFDYQLRPGVATSRNALRLMEAIGLRRTTGNGGE